MYPETTKPADPSPRRRAHAATISDADMRKYGRHLLTPLSEVTALEGRMKGPDMSRTARERLTPALKALLQAPAGWRHQVRVRQRFVPELAVLRTHFPQCAAVIDHVEAMAHLACRGDRVVRLPPLLLVGPPGVGKTYFAQRLAATLHLPYEEVHMESATAAWILSGMDSTWNESKPGRIFETLVHGRFANPLILLDEIDKVGSGNRYDPMGSLYGLLEPHTASRFRDEYACIPTDASRINWVLTANELDTVPLPIRDRTQVFQIPEPTFAQRMAIAEVIYQKLLASESWGGGFDPVLEQTTLVSLAEAAASPRDLRQILTLACARAAARGTSTLLACDVEATNARVLPSGIDLRSAVPMGNA